LGAELTLGDLAFNLAASWLKQEAQGQLREPDLDFFERLFRTYQGDAEAQVGEIFAALFAALPDRLRPLLLGVVVYRDAFDLAMAQAMLPDATAADLHTLTDQAFLQQESQRWILHPLMQNLVQQALQSSALHQESHQKAIAYFTTQIKPDSQRATLTDCAAELELFHHHCELKAYAPAYQILHTCVHFLDLHGYSRELLPLYERLT
jgi:hypothetical protein